MTGPQHRFTNEFVKPESQYNSHVTFDPLPNTSTSYYSLEHPNGTKLLEHVCYRFILLRQKAHISRSIKLGTVPLNGGCITLDMYVTSKLKTNITPVIELPGSTLHRNQVLISGWLYKNGPQKSRHFRNMVYYISEAFPAFDT